MRSEENQFEQVKATIQTAEAFEAHPDDITSEDLRDMTNKNRAAKPNQEPLGAIEENQNEQVEVIERSQSIVNIQINKQISETERANEPNEQNGNLEHVPSTPNDQSSPPKLEKTSEADEDAENDEAKEPGEKVEMIVEEDQE